MDKIFFKVKKFSLDNQRKIIATDEFDDRLKAEDFAREQSQSNPKYFYDIFMHDGIDEQFISRLHLGRKDIEIS